MRNLKKWALVSHGMQNPADISVASPKNTSEGHNPMARLATLFKMDT